MVSDDTARTHLTQSAIKSLIHREVSLKTQTFHSSPSTGESLGGCLDHQKADIKTDSRTGRNREQMGDTSGRDGTDRKASTRSKSALDKGRQPIRRDRMQKKKTFSTMEIVLLVVLIGSLILSFLQARREEAEHDSET